MANKISEQYRCLLDILTCPVCKQIVKQAHICPNCSKFYCHDCIINQLSQELSCLNCNKFLQVPMLINCQRLCKELKETLDKSSHRPEESLKNKRNKKEILFCNNHQLQKTYYCQTCEEPLCSDCSVLTQQHRGHQFIKLSIIKADYEQKISDMTDKIRQVRKTIKKKLGLTEQKNQKRQTSSQKSISSLQTTLKFLKESISKKTKRILTQNQKDLTKYQSQLQYANKKYKNLLNLLKNCSKVEFVQQEYSKVADQLNKLIEDGNSSNKAMKYINNKLKPMVKFQSYIHPNYQNFTFFVEKYSEKIDREVFFYTEQVVNMLGNIWRLKIYPKGIVHEADKKLEPENPKLARKQSKNEQYFAIFIQLVDGPSKTTKQKHQIILINHLNQNKNFLRQYQSQFDVGQCWGYEHFIKLNQLYNDGFYNDENDTMQIRLNICPANYYQASIDQMNSINLKRQILQNQQNVMVKLKQKFMIERQDRSMERLREAQGQMLEVG